MTEPTITRRPRGKRTAVPDAASLTSGSSTSTTELLGTQAHPRLLETTVLHPHPANPSHRSDVDFDDLAEAIRADGEISQPITVRPLSTTPGEYEVLDGHRRLAAAQLLGMALVPVRVKDLDDAEALFLVLRANQARRDFTPVEEARLVQATLDLPGMTQKRIAERVGRSTSWVSERAKAAKTPSAILDALADKQPTFDQLEAIAEFDGTPEVDRLIEAAGTRDFAITLDGARRSRERAARIAEIRQTLDAAGAKPLDGPVPETHVYDYDLSGQTYDPETTATRLSKVSDAHLYTLEHGYLQLHRPRTAKELEQIAELDARAAERTAENEAVAAERAERATAFAVLRDFADASGSLRREFLMDAIHTSARPHASTLAAIADYFATRVATETLAEDLWLDPEALRTWLRTPIPEDDDYEYEAGLALLHTEVAALPVARRLLLVATSLSEPITTEGWTRPDELARARAWYDLLVTLGYTPSTAELDALAIPEAQAA